MATISKLPPFQDGDNFDKYPLCVNENALGNWFILKFKLHFMHN